MAKTFREWPVDQAWLLPPSVRELLPANDPAHFVRDLVREQLDLSAILGTYTEERGYPPYHPAMLTALILFGYTQGVYASRKIARACHTRVDFMAVAAMQKPDFRTISDFRLRHLEALGGLFQQVLMLCAGAGLVKLGHVALDGTKIKANASKHKAMGYDRMKKREVELQAEIAGWFEKAQAADEAEDREFGRDRAGDELPAWVANKQQRLEKIREAKARLEAEAKAQLAAGVKPSAPDDDGPDKPGGKRNRQAKRPTADGEPHETTQLNFTDPDSKILKTKDGFTQGYNCQAAVDAQAQVIVAHATEAAQNDVQQLVPMVTQIRERLGRNPKELSADAGYLSEVNLRELEQQRITGYVAAGRETKKGAGKKPKSELALAMKRKLARGGYRSRYRLRKQVVEPVFGQMKAARGFRSMSLRGIAKVPHEWAMVCTAHNLLKLAKK
jgi:transposase